MAHVLSQRPIDSLDRYIDGGGGRVLAACRRLGPNGVIDEVRASGLRGRGGAGFPTGIKWGGLAADEAEEKFVVCNAAEGEPGTFKDRAILRRNPYQVIEGLAAAAFAVGARRAFIGIKGKFEEEMGHLERAAGELAAAQLIGDVDIAIVPGPDDYLFGEEKALLEVIEGGDPLPRLYPPYVRGLFEKQAGPSRPVVVNNVETLAHAAHVIVNGADWFRSLGTRDSPGTMVCTIGGDTAVDAVAELEMGTPLRTLVETVGGGTRSQRPISIVLNGVSNAPLREVDLVAAISFEGMESAGSGLGSAGFTVYDDTACPVAVAAAASAFLYRGSCGQCPPCKLGTSAFTERFVALAMGGGAATDVEDLLAWTMRVTDANRCGLGAGARSLALGMLQRFPEDFERHVSGDPCPSDRATPVTTIVDWDEAAGRFTYASTVSGDTPGA